MENAAMAVTRDQASRLLSESEMTLFSESRNPALRSFSARELIRRIERARKLRDKSRDLLQRQRLGSRKRTGSKGGATGEVYQRRTAPPRRLQVLRANPPQPRGRARPRSHRSRRWRRPANCCRPSSNTIASHAPTRYWMSKPEQGTGSPATSRARRSPKRRSYKTEKSCWR